MLAIWLAARLVERCASPAALAADVELVLEDVEAGGLEALDPFVGRSHDLPALVVAEPRRNGHEHAAVPRDDTPELAECGLVPGSIARRVDRVDVVVPTDV